MLRNKVRNIIYPNKVNFLLMFIPFILTIIFISLSSLSIYYIASFLVDEMFSPTANMQTEFGATLSRYLWIFGVSAVLFGGLIHFYVMNKMTTPLNQLIESVELMKQGQYQPLS